MKAKKVLEFKTITPFFELCRDGQKLFDIRMYDPKDSRFKALHPVRFIKDLKGWVVRFTNPATGDTFCRILTGWDYMTDQNHWSFKPNWIIIYLGDLVNVD